MLQRIREQIGSAGLVVAMIALIAALGGGAYAASGGLTGKQKKEVKTIAKSVAKAGPQGPQGPAGANGKDGANGSTGATGGKGDKGEPGDDGDPGDDGKSIVQTPVTALDCEEREGVFLEAEGEPLSKTEICEGKEGEQGEPGNPWVPDNTLPKGATLTGVWAFHGRTEQVTVEVLGVKSTVTVGDTEAWVPFSFPIRLENTLGGVQGAATAKFHYTTEPNFIDFDEAGPETVGCTGSPALPTAPEGHLCVYQSGITGATYFETRQPGGGTKGSGRAGGFLKFTVTGAPASGSGTWAVTAP